MREGRGRRPRCALAVLAAVLVGDCTSRLLAIDIEHRHDRQAIEHNHDQHHGPAADHDDKGAANRRSEDPGGHMENHGDGAIIGNSAAPFQNSLVHNYAAFTNSAGVSATPVSPPNYVAFVSGQDNGQAGVGDCSASIGSSCNWSGANLGVQLQQAGIPQAWYAEGLSGNGRSISNANSGDAPVMSTTCRGRYMDTWQSDTAHVPMLV